MHPNAGVSDWRGKPGAHGAKRNARGLVTESAAADDWASGYDEAALRQRPKNQSINCKLSFGRLVKSGIVDLFRSFFDGFHGVYHAAANAGGWW